ncbi:hypothetical protein GWI33_013336 [Rhynchophorus ferrugineus]|uniref:Uncharacterized protein n=1 Tax=Rhynchophorus ferrugineus TaxID=354439 RepID=A0A834I3L4_RHYFE|nr:hypothetical protein GWI33_013336 [Rhynchophorus ferrugineus]
MAGIFSFAVHYTFTAGFCRSKSYGVKEIRRLMRPFDYVASLDTDKNGNVPALRFDSASYDRDRVEKDETDSERRRIRSLMAPVGRENGILSRRANCPLLDYARTEEFP